MRLNLLNGINSLYQAKEIWQIQQGITEITSIINVSSERLNEPSARPKYFSSKLKFLFKGIFNKYIPHYSKHLNQWGKISTWDHNQIGTALLVFFDDSYFNYDIHEKVSEVIYGQIFNTLSDEMQDFLNKEYDKKEAEKAQLSLF